MISCDTSLAFSKTVAMFVTHCFVQLSHYCYPKARYFVGICVLILSIVLYHFIRRFSVCYKLENGRYGHVPIRSNTSIRVYTTADTDTSTLCVGVPATCIIRQGRSLRERSLYAMGGSCRPLAINKLARSVSFMTQQKR